MVDFTHIFRVYCPSTGTSTTIKTTRNNDLHLISKNSESKQKKKHISYGIYCGLILVNLCLSQEICPCTLYITWPKCFYLDVPRSYYITESTPIDLSLVHYHCVQVSLIRQTWTTLIFSHYISHYSGVTWGLGISNHRQHDCLLIRLLRLTAMKTSKLRITDHL